MATAVSKRLGGGLSFVLVGLLLSFAVLGAAGEESSYTPGTDDSGLPMESELAGETAADGLSYLLKESQEIDTAYRKAMKQAKTVDLMNKGLAAATGASLLGLIGQTGLMIKKGAPVSKTRGGLAIGTAIMGLAALGGVLATLMQKKKLLKNASAQAASLLKNREEMLDKIQQNEVEDTDALVDRTEEIANLADSLGLYYPKNTAQD